jgi:aldose 1-epimerase
MNLKTKPWGKTRQGESASKYILTNENGMEVVLSDFSGSIIDIRLPIKGQMRSVVLGYDTIE